MAAAGKDGGVSWVTRGAFSSTVHHRLPDVTIPRISVSGEPSRRQSPSPANPAAGEGGDGGDGGAIQARQGEEDHPCRRKENARPWTRFFSYFMRRRVQPEVKQEETREAPKLYVGSRISVGSLGRDNRCDVLYRGVYGDQHVAAKVMTPPADDGTVAANLCIRFIREAHFLSRLKHPNVIKMVAAGEIPSGSWCVCTEYLHAGGSLRDLLWRSRNCPLDLRKLTAIALNIARGMVHVHAEGIIHRGLTPENILIVDEESSCRAIIDGFGGACEEGQSEPVAYTSSAAPEMIKEEPYDRKVDVYSFGLLLWEMQTGMVPFENMTKAEVISKVVLQEMRPAVPARCVSALEWVIESCWAPLPEERPQFSTILKVLERLQCAVTIAYEDG